MKNFALKMAAAAFVAFTSFGCSSDDKDQEIVVECPQGFTGAGCLTQITPKKITITKITVKGFPVTDAGANWDNVVDNSLPDIYVGLFNSEGQPLYVSQNYYADATTGVFEFVPDTTLDITSIGGIYNLSLYDYDLEDTISNEDDLMGETFTYLYSSNGGFPAIKTVQNGDFFYELSLKYTW
jgi:hypothetical protein